MSLPRLFNIFPYAINVAMYRTSTACPTAVLSFLINLAVRMGHTFLPEIHVSERPTKFVGPIDCLNLQSSFLPLTVYGWPVHQAERRFCTHSLRRLFRYLPGWMPRQRIVPSSGWSGCVHRTRRGCFHRCSEQAGYFCNFSFFRSLFFGGFIQFPMSLRTDSMKFALSS